MKTIKMLIALLAFSPSLAFAGSWERGWGRHREESRREARYDYGYARQRAYAPSRIAYEAPQPVACAPARVVYEAPRPALYVPAPRVYVPAPVALGVAATLATGLLIANLAHVR